jgi:hypothetical protein
LASCGAFVALIGQGSIERLSRLQEGRDYVRMEIASVLARGGLLVPVLAGGAKMPKNQRNCRRNRLRSSAGCSICWNGRYTGLTDAPSS